MAFTITLMIIIVIGILMPNPRCETCNERTSRECTGGMETEAVYVCDKCV
jgi:hypothetical protein